MGGGCSICSLLMAALFAYSASVQLNDHDWYFWFPLYTCACLVNLRNCGFFSIPTISTIATTATVTWVGLILFIKVVIEDYVEGIAGFWSLDMTHRVVREKIGSGLVVISMILHLEHFVARKRNEFPFLVNYGMAILAGVTYGLSFAFFMVQKGQMKF